MANNNKFNNIKVKGIHDFAEDYLTTILCLLKSAEKNKNSDDVFTYLLTYLHFTDNYSFCMFFRIKYKQYNLFVFYA